MTVITDSRGFSCVEDNEPPTLLRTAGRPRLTTLAEVCREIIEGNDDIVAGDKWFVIYDGVPLPCRLTWSIDNANLNLYDEHPYKNYCILNLKMDALTPDGRKSVSCRHRAHLYTDHIPKVWGTIHR